MSIPRVEVTRVDGQTGVIPEAADGIAAIIAPSSTGDQDVPTTCTRKAAAVSGFGRGQLTSFASYIMGKGGKPTILIRPATSTAGDYSAITKVAWSTGTTDPAETSSTYPYDDFDVVIKFLTGGALGTAGITYQESIDGGRTFSAVKALGTALVIAIPDTGISVTLGTSTQTIIANSSITFTTSSPQATTSDLVASLAALREASLAWEYVYVAGDATADHVAALDSWLAALEQETGRFRFAIMNVARRTSAQSEAQYRTALQAVRAAGSSLRVVLCADAGDLVDDVYGVRMVRPMALGLAGRISKIGRAVEPAQVSDGPIEGFAIIDERGNPKFHNELYSPGLDDLKMVSFRSFEGKSGCYVTNGLVYSPDGSDYVLVPQLRVINRACEIVHATLQECLNRGVSLHPKPGPNGARYISFEDRKAIEAFVNGNLSNELEGQVSEVAFALSADDDISSNDGATLSGKLEIVSLKYIKKFRVQASFVKEITARAA